MNENEIYTRLGLENKKELLELLDFSDRTKKIKPFCPSINLQHAHPIRLILKDTNYLEITDNETRAQSFLGVRKGWETLLRPTTQHVDLKPLNRSPVEFPNKLAHYFIPNIDLDFDLSTLHEDDRELSYSDFYKNGYSEKYKKYFKNSDRDEREIAENIGSNDFYLDIKEKYICPITKIEVKTIYWNLENSSNTIFSREEIQGVEEYLSNKNRICMSKNKNIAYPVKNDEKIYISWNVAKNS